MAEKAESRAVELDIHGKKRVFDIDNPVLPDWIDEKAFGSDDYPYGKKLDNKEYEKTLKLLQIELVKVQFWQQKTGTRIMSVFEGRDAAGKGGAIHATMSYMNPRSARIVALTKPTETERGQWYFQRYISHFPTAGELVLFDRSWYNRAGVEPVMVSAPPRNINASSRKRRAWKRCSPMRTSTFSSSGSISDGKRRSTVSTIAAIAR